MAESKKTLVAVAPRTPKSADTFVAEGSALAIHDGPPAAALEAAPAPARPLDPVPAGREALVVTTFRITAAQARALRRAALELQEARGGKADASEVLRSILDTWMGT